MKLKVTSTRKGKGRLITVEGRIESDTSPLLESRIEGVFDNLPKSPEVVIDLSDVSYISSSGIRVFVTATKKALRRKGHFTLIRIQPKVMETIKLGGFDWYFDIGTEEDLN